MILVQDSIDVSNSFGAHSSLGILYNRFSYAFRSTEILQLSPFSYGLLVVGGREIL